MEAKMHADQAETDDALVRRLLAGQFPQWAGLRIDRVASSGTDHDIYRLGDDLVVRLPKIGWAIRQAAREAEWLPRFAPHLPLAIPQQVARGKSAEAYPFEWSIYRWLPGENASIAVFDSVQAAIDLATFVRALRRISVQGAHSRVDGARGAPLAELDESVRRAIVELDDRIDGATALRSWNESLNAPMWGSEEVWVHGDLLPGNLLFVRGRLSAVIDWGTLNVGDPACDLQAAWNVFQGESRRRFRAALNVDDASWRRGRGWALAQAVMALPYYWDTNPGIVRQATHALSEVLAESAL
jgi:aminoglycoside phosphotransferase (APT) family kinase protein